MLYDHGFFFLLYYISDKNFIGNGFSIWLKKKLIVFDIYIRSNNKSK